MTTFKTITGAPLLTADDTIPFKSAEEAWFWFIQAQTARNEGAKITAGAGLYAPPLTPWFGLKAGTDLTPDEAKAIAPALEKAARLLQAHFDQSNFIVEIHQCFLDLVVAGTASLVFEEADIGELSVLVEI